MVGKIVTCQNLILITKPRRAGVIISQIHSGESFGITFKGQMISVDAVPGRDPSFIALINDAEHRKMLLIKISVE